MLLISVLSICHFCLCFSLEGQRCRTVKRLNPGSKKICNSPCREIRFGFGGTKQCHIKTLTASTKLMSSFLDPNKELFRVQRKGRERERESKTDLERISP